MKKVVKKKGAKGSTETTTTTSEETTTVTETTNSKSQNGYENGKRSGLVLKHVCLYTIARAKTQIPQVQRWT